MAEILQGDKHLKSVICDCGESRCFPKLYANSVSLECASCGEIIRNADPSIAEASMYIYNHNRKEIKEFFADDKELLVFCLEIKNTQEEEEYKRKIGMTRDGNVGQ